MAMVKIIRTNGVGGVKRVSRKAFENIFKKQGYALVEEKKVEEQKQPISVEETEGTETEADELETIPVSEMNKEQLMKFAKKHDIDTSDAKNVSEARKIIQKAIQQSKM